MRSLQRGSLSGREQPAHRVGGRVAVQAFPDAARAFRERYSPLLADDVRNHPCRERLPGAISEMPLIGNEIGVVAVHELVAMALGRLFGLRGHRTSP
jgi:hypothetical protein